MHTPLSPTIGMRFGDHLFPAEPVHLDGHRASLAVDPNQPMGAGPTRLRLGWSDGRVTELSVQMREHDLPSGVAHLDICAVEGDWRPFLDYLAHTLN
jgi:hypothetical protein